MKPTIHFPDPAGQDRVIAGADFEARCLRAASVLHRAGIGAGDVLALLMRNGPQMLEAMLAARWLGAQWCPVNWHFRADEVNHILADSGARVLLADADLLDTLPELQLAGLTVYAARPEGAASGAPTGAPADTPTGPPAGALPGPWPTWAALRDAAPAWDRPAAAPRGAMFYTSGTTGRPKGIRRAAATPEQAERSREVLRHVLGFEPGMRALVSAPMYHSAPNTYSIGAAMEDAELFIESRFDAERTLALIERERLSHAYLVPTMYARLLALPEAVRRRHDVGSMRFVASTGSPCPPALKRAMIEWWGPVIHEAYGASELGYMTRLDSDEALRKPGSAGRPLPGVTIQILDEQGQRLPQGQAGLIHIHQPAYADFDYINNPDARRRMERHGLKTLGDVGYLDEDGYLFIVDRAADLVISGGVNIYPAEIEAVLQAMPGVADCAVFGIPDAEYGEALAAAVRPAPGAALDAAAVQDWVRARMAGFKVPRLVTFHDELPREDTGKIFKRKLREPYWAGLERRI